MVRRYSGLWSDPTPKANVTYDDGDTGVILKVAPRQHDRFLGLKYCHCRGCMLRNKPDESRGKKSRFVESMFVEDFDDDIRNDVRPDSKGDSKGDSKESKTCDDKKKYP